jgi:putative transposase
VVGRKGTRQAVTNQGQIFQKLDYIHNNPLKAGLCKYPEQYEFSSARFYVDGIDSWNMLTHIDS